MVDVIAGIAGTWSLARGERGWEDRMPMDAGAVFTSFWAVPLALPAVAVTAYAGRQAVRASGAEAALEAAAATAVPINVAAAIASWALSLLVLVQLANRPGEARVAAWRVSPLIVGYNWSRLIVNGVAGLGALVILATGAWPVLSLTGLVVLTLTVWLDVGVIRHALALTPGRTAGALAFVLLARVLAVLGVGALAQVFVAL